MAAPYADCSSAGKNTKTRNFLISEVFLSIMWVLNGLIGQLFSKEDCTVIKVNQEELKQKIEKLKKAAAEKAAKSGGKKSEPEARKALKQVKRAQRKLRTAKTYKLASKKAAEAKAGGEKASA
jgi:hypothetical protein